VGDRYNPSHSIAVSAQDTSDSFEGARPQGTARIGRRVGVALFWVMCVFLIGMSSRSIIPALYFPHSAPVPEGTEVAKCATELRALERELSTAAATAVEQGSVERWIAGRKTWDARYLALSGGCGTLESAREDLGVLRSELDALLRAYGDGAQATQDRLRRTLAAFAEPNPGPT